MVSKRGILEIVALIAINVVFVTACYKGSINNTHQAVITGVSTERSSKDVINDEATLDSFSFPDSYSRKSNKVVFEIDNIICPETVVVSKGKAKKVGFDKDGLAKFFLKDIDYTIQDGNYISTNADYSDRVYTKGFNYISSESDKVQRIYYDLLEVGSRKDDSWLNYYKEKSQFDFGSEEDCLKDIYTLFQDYGLDLNSYSFNISVYYLDHSRVNPIGEELTKQDDYYIFCFDQMCQGLRDYHHFHGDYYGGISCPDEFTFQVIYGSNGVASIRSNRDLYDYEFYGESPKLKSFEDIAQTVEKWCNDTIDFGSSFRITRAELYVGYNKGLELHYIWNFLVDIVNKENGNISNMELNFDAETGSYVRID